jgi:hypothetical protein
VMSCESVGKWLSDFKSDWIRIMDNEGSGRPTTNLAALRRSGAEWFRFFPALKDHHSGHRFASVDVVETAGMRRLKPQGTELNDAWIDKPIQRLDKCLNFRQDYVEK